MNRNKNEPMTRYWPGAITCRKAGEGQEESRQAVLSLSSEEPCKRWFGNEILCHDAGAINLARLKEIGVVLFNHNTNEPIGRVLSVELDEIQRKLRAVVEFDDDEDSDMTFPPAIRHLK